MESAKSLNPLFKSTTMVQSILDSFDNKKVKHNVHNKAQ